MRYLPELYYFFDQEDFPLRQALVVTAQALGPWCRHFHVHLITPRDGVDPATRSGVLPETASERDRLIQELIDWALDNSLSTEAIALWFDPDPVPRSGEIALFDHHDDTCCWILNLTAEQSTAVRLAWKTNDLPEDLFYPEGNGHEEAILLKDWLKDKPSRLPPDTKITRYFTPKRWENHLAEQKGSRAASP